MPLDSVIRTSQKVAGVFIIQEAQGRKAIHLQWLGNSDHKTLIMNKKHQLTNKLQKSIMNLLMEFYLGMNRQAVIDLLGTPSSSEKMHSRETLKYSEFRT